MDMSKKWRRSSGNPNFWQTGQEEVRAIPSHPLLCVLDRVQSGPRGRRGQCTSSTVRWQMPVISHACTLLLFIAPYNLALTILFL